MKKEIEAVFCGIDKDKVRERLQALDARLVAPERKMVRTVFKGNGAEWEHSFLRVRDEGGKIVVTYKNFVGSGATGVKELNLEVDDYDAAVELFRVLGFREKSYEESLRETWELDGAEVDIDTWPWLPPYVEVEGKSVKNMTEVSSKLGFDMEDAIYDSVDGIYGLYYDVPQEDINAGKGGWNRIEFAPTPEWLKNKKRSK